MSIFCNEETRTKRYNICKECEHFRAVIKQCKLCNCFIKNLYFLITSIIFIINTKIVIINSIYAILNDI